MIVVDTNIISEFMLTKPDPTVIDWFNQQNSRNLYVTVITLAEVGYGLSLIPDGQRKRNLESRFKGFVAKAFEERVLDFDKASVDAYIDISSSRKKMGLTISMADAQIAAISRVHNFSISTRNTKDFDFCGIELINPFEAR